MAATFFIPASDVLNTAQGMEFLATHDLFTGSKGRNRDPLSEEMRCPRGGK